MFCLFISFPVSAHPLSVLQASYLQSPISPLLSSLFYIVISPFFSSNLLPTSHLHLIFIPSFFFFSFSSSFYSIRNPLIPLLVFTVPSTVPSLLSPSPSSKNIPRVPFFALISITTTFFLLSLLCPSVSNTHTCFCYYNHVFLLLFRLYISFICFPTLPPPLLTLPPLWCSVADKREEKSVHSIKKLKKIEQRKH